MRAWRSRVILLLAIVLLPLEGVLILWIWPYSPIIAEAIVVLFVVCCACLGAYGVAWVVFRIAWMKTQHDQGKRRSRVIEAAGLAVLELADGTYRHLSAEHEAAKLLPAPVGFAVSEVKSEAYSPDDLLILSKISEGMAQEKVAKICNTNQTYVSRLVRRWKDQTGMV